MERQVRARVQLISRRNYKDQGSICEFELQRSYQKIDMKKRKDLNGRETRIMLVFVLLGSGKGLNA